MPGETTGGRRGLVERRSFLSLREYRLNVRNSSRHQTSLWRHGLLAGAAKNKWRSPTAEAIYRKDPRINVRSAGTSSSARKQISESDILWADLILAMENQHQKIITSQYKYLNLPSIVVLDIPDDYQYMSTELIEMIETSTEEILSNWS